MHACARFYLANCLSFDLAAFSVQFADGTVDDWSVEDMAPAVKSLKTRRAKGAARRQQKRRVAGMSATELAAAGVQAFRAQQYEEALEIFEHAQQVVDPKADPQTALNVNNYLGVSLRIGVFVLPGERRADCQLRYTGGTAGARPSIRSDTSLYECGRDGSGLCRGAP
jgi:hypothetical protein